MTKTALLRLTRAALISASCLCATIPALAQQQPGMPSEAAPAEDAGPPIDLKADWPCVQGKVETLTIAQMWDGPSTEGKKGWGQDRQLSALITILASRRIPEADAEGALKKYADSVPEAERDDKLTLLFAGLFDKVNMERKSVISGIEKYQKAQRTRAQELERQTTEIAKLEREAPSNESAANELAQANEKFSWAQRIFQERQQSIPLACELPTMMEERLGSMSRAIRALMKA